MSVSFIPDDEAQRYFASLAGRISSARREIGFTQSEMASMAGTSLSTYRKIENGDASVSAETLWRVIKTIKFHLKRDLMVNLI